MKGQRRGAAKDKRIRKLLEDCMILCVSLVLSEPRQTPRQGKMLPNLIKRLRQEIQSGDKESP